MEVVDWKVPEYSEVEYITLALEVMAVQVERQTCLYTGSCGQSCITGQVATYTWSQRDCGRCRLSWEFRGRCGRRGLGWSEWHCGGWLLWKGWQVYVNKWLQHSPDVPGSVLFVLILSLGFN